MQLSPRMYHTLVRPKWFTKKYIENHLKEHFNFKNKSVLDFGSGTGANCSLCTPSEYLGIDPDLKRIEFAKKLYPNYHFQVFSGTEIPVEDKSVDVILIISVLHHIPPEVISTYVKEFKRILRNNGTVVAIEPCLFDHTRISNWFMKRYDKGKYIRKESDYLSYFLNENFQCKVLKKFKKCFLYNELYFRANL
ncbi:MAG TPA: class I SAM-dependent methyltransferase [Metabacillus sp.]|nr:class I SAM-dependent methyltransferase [Metabacillus sp.]